MRSYARVAKLVLLLLVLGGQLGCRRPEGEKNCRAIALGTDVSTLPVHTTGTSGPYGDAGRPLTRVNLGPVTGPGNELTCCESCKSQNPCECGSSSVDCSDPSYAVNWWYTTLEGNFSGECLDNPDGAWECGVAVRDDKVVAVFGNCWD